MGTGGEGVAEHQIVIAPCLALRGTRPVGKVGPNLSSHLTHAPSCQEVLDAVFTIYLATCVRHLDVHYLLRCQRQGAVLAQVNLFHSFACSESAERSRS